MHGLLRHARVLFGGGTLLLLVPQRLTQAAALDNELRRFFVGALQLFSGRRLAQLRLLQRGAQTQQLAFHLADARIRRLSARFQLAHARLQFLGEMIVERRRRQRRRRGEHRDVEIEVGAPCGLQCGGAVDALQHAEHRGRSGRRVALDAQAAQVERASAFVACGGELDARFLAAHRLGDELLHRRVVFHRHQRGEAAADDILRAADAELLHARHVHREHLARLIQQDDAGGQRFDDQAEARFAALQLFEFLERGGDGAIAVRRETQRRTEAVSELRPAHQIVIDAGGERRGRHGAARRRHRDHGHPELPHADVVNQLELFRLRQRTIHQQDVVGGGLIGTRAQFAQAGADVQRKAWFHATDFLPQDVGVT